ncbi:MAG: hypothetical protein K6C32_00975 [Bacilli bacterium]|nr:hypothetical protein [Bacilli bacterium]
MKKILLPLILLTSLCGCSSPKVNSSYVFQFYVENANNDNIVTYDFTQQTNCDRFVENHKEYVSSVSVDEGMFSQVNFVGDKGDSNRFATLILGSAKKEGNINLTFVKDITHIDVVASTYYKTYTGGINVDSTSALLINDVSYNITPKSTTEVPEHLNFNIDFENPIQELKIYSDSGRAFIHSLTITYN